MSTRSKTKDPAASEHGQCWKGKEAGNGRNRRNRPLLFTTNAYPRQPIPDPTRPLLDPFQALPVCYTAVDFVLRVEDELTQRLPCLPSSVRSFLIDCEERFEPRVGAAREAE